MSRLCMVAMTLALVTAACAPPAPGALEPEQVAVYLLGEHPTLNEDTHRILGTYAVSGGSLVNADRMLRNVRVEAARRGAEYVVLLVPTQRRGSVERTVEPNMTTLGELEGSFRHSQRLAFVAVGRKPVEEPAAPGAVAPVAKAAER